MKVISILNNPDNVVVKDYNDVAKISHAVETEVVIGERFAITNNNIIARESSPKNYYYLFSTENVDTKEAHTVYISRIGRRRVSLTDGSRANGDHFMAQAYRQYEDVMTLTRLFTEMDLQQGDAHKLLIDNNYTIIFAGEGEDASPRVSREGLEYTTRVSCYVLADKDGNILNSEFKPATLIADNATTTEPTPVVDATATDATDATTTVDSTATDTTAQA